MTERTALWVVVWEDRHVDIGVFLFTQLHEALAWAAVQAHKAARGSAVAITPIPSWEYYAEYGDGGSLRVQRVEVDAEVKVAR